MIYADTNFLVALYCRGPNEDEALRLHAEAVRRREPAYPVTMLCRLEFVNALQQSIHFTRQGLPGIRITPEHALAVEATFFTELSSGNMLTGVAISERRLEQQFQDICHRHTAREGFRTYDILHVSSALVLGCEAFWSFDQKACKLARLEGLFVS